MPTVFDVADYLLAKYQSEEDFQDDPITHMKLQKLVYYAQGFSLALYGQPLFSEPLEAWEHGPVCPILYQNYKEFLANPIKTDKTLDTVSQEFSLDQLTVMNLTIRLCGPSTALQLRNMSHADNSWKNAIKNYNKTININDIKNSCQKHLEIRSYSVIPSKEEQEEQWKLADEQGIPDTLDVFND
jgi:uncharacterized phage-associated protein